MNMENQNENTTKDKNKHTRERKSNQNQKERTNRVKKIRRNTDTHTRNTENMMPIKRSPHMRNPNESSGNEKTK